MPIHYSLNENKLTSTPDDFRAVVHPIITSGHEQVIEHMINQGTTVNRPDILASLEGYFSAVESMVLAGHNVNTPIANFGASIKGVFDSPSDQFDHTRHQLCARVTPGVRLRKAIAHSGIIRKQEAKRRQPAPTEFIDINSGERNDLMTPGGMAQLYGHRLQFDASQAEQGIFLIAHDGNHTRVEVLGSNRPSKLVFMIPDGLAPGQYTLEVRAILRFSQDLRRGSLATHLTVA